jgi:hypothetical protein
MKYNERGTAMYARAEKEEHLDIIRYEIDMLDFVYKRYADLDCGQQTSDQGDLNAYLECFLLHYRNLVEFFSKKDIRNDETNLRIYLPLAWASGKLDVEEAKKAIRQDLFEKHWKRLSIYLAHCTTYRVKDPAKWKPQEMYDELNQTLVDFERVMQFHRLRPGGVPPVAAPRMTSGSSGSTETLTRT